MYGWRKATEEFIKRMDPDLPFHYHTSGHSRYYTDLMPDFCTKPPKSKKITRIPRYELLGANNRVTLAVRGESSIRTKFHNVPVDLPPPPGAHNQSAVHEHSYCNNSNK